jgi:hypothetical protein
MAGEIANMMGGLPMGELIGGPLIAVVSAQKDLADVMIGYINTVGFDPENAAKARMLEFNIKRPIAVGDEISTTEVSMQAPLLGLLPMPALLVDTVTIDFQMEVSTATSSKSNTNAEVSASASGGFFGQKYSVSGKVSTSKENTRSTNQTAKYQVHVEAKQQPQTECMGKLMDLLASCTEPVQIAVSPAA